jgi:hypothetical protein
MSIKEDTTFTYPSPERIENTKLPSNEKTQKDVEVKMTEALDSFSKLSPVKSSLVKITNKYNRKTRHYAQNRRSNDLPSQNQRRGESAVESTEARYGSIQGDPKVL